MPARRLSLLRMAGAACTVAASGLALACAPHIEPHPQWDSFRFRPHTTDLEDCRVSEQTYRQVVSDWLRSQPQDLTPMRSMFVGRAVDFPWLSRHLADAALKLPGWTTRATPRERERLAEAVLSDPALRQRLAMPFHGSPYEVAQVSYEKLLFGPAHRHASDANAGSAPVLYDAQLWLRLVPRRH